MRSQNHPIILFIDRFGFYIYQDTLTNIPKFNFTPDLVSNLDVVNKDQLTNLIATFIQINKIVGSDLAVILSDNVIYTKDLVTSVQKPAPVQNLKIESDDKEHDGEVQSFLEDVPFEEVLAKVIKVGNVSRIVAVNKDLVMTIVSAFTSKGAVVEAIVPSFMYGQNANFTTGLTADNVRVVLENAEILKSGNLLTDQEKISVTQYLENELRNPPAEEKKPKNRRQYLLIGVFIFLLIVLAIVYFTMGTSPEPSVKNVANSGTTTNTSSAIPTSAQQLAIPTPIDFRLVNIKISRSIESAGVAASLTNGLSKIGFQNVTEEISEVSIPEKSSVIFSQNIPADLRSAMIVEINKILPGISVLENQDPGFTVNIMVGKT